VTRAPRGPEASAPGEVLFEIRIVGNVARCAAIDADTGLEVVALGPAAARDADLKTLALRKLRLRQAQR
jgi:hypothetical protein